MVCPSRNSQRRTYPIIKGWALLSLFTKLISPKVSWVLALPPLPFFPPIRAWDSTDLTSCWFEPSGSNFSLLKQVFLFISSPFPCFLLRLLSLNNKTIMYLWGSWSSQKSCPFGIVEVNKEVIECGLLGIFFVFVFVFPAEEENEHLGKYCIVSTKSDLENFFVL